jgi:alkylation response protein AidB-like acyl-CoA dehydrogenase
MATSVSSPSPSGSVSSGSGSSGSGSSGPGSSVALPRGGAWLIADVTAADVLTPERLTDEHRLIAATAAQFVAQEVAPARAALEDKDWKRARQLVRRAGELGLLATDVPEAFGGLALDKISSVIVAAALSADASFATTYGAMTGLAILPLIAFGTEDQQARYLPGLASGELVGAYALSESGSGSDALGARARATRLDDGSYALSGEKMWITNCGFADVFIVFAKVDGEAFTAFIVERGFPGVSTGEEEHKMGLHASSTRPLILNDARVPAANVLGEVGRGHKVAFNVLNYGRLKLGASTAGGARTALAEATAYAADRRQFGQPIASFGAVRSKLATMAIRIYALDSLLIRTADLIDRAIEGGEGTPAARLLAALEEYAIEASIAKVAGSEVADYVVDENVQIHGGNGFVRDYAAERRYRDARVNRIFEGTNEINRLLIAGLLARRAAKGDIGLIAAAKRLADEVTGPLAGDGGDDAPLAAARRTVAGLKKTVLLVLGTAMQRYAEKLADEQEILMLASDLVIEAYAAESALLRAEGAAAGSLRHADVHAAMAVVAVADAAARAEMIAREAVAALTDGDARRVTLAALRRLLKAAPVDTVALRRTVAAHVVASGGAGFDLR